MRVGTASGCFATMQWQCRRADEPNFPLTIRSQGSLRTLGAKRLMEVTHVVEFEELQEGEQLFSEGDPSLVRRSSIAGDEASDKEVVHTVL